MAHLSNQRVIDAWVRTPDMTGKNEANSLSYCNGVLSSYREPIARRVRDDLCLVTVKKWSPTTSKHLSSAKVALPGRCKIVEVWDVTAEYSETVAEG